MDRLRGLSDLDLETGEALLPWIALLVLQGAIVATYLQITGSSINRFRYIIYPFIWINLGLWAITRTRPLAAPSRIRWAAILGASLYFGLLLVLPGKVGLASSVDLHSGLVVRWAVPGWGPILAYSGEIIRFYFVPFEVIGYLALAYLVYVHLVQFTRTSLAGAVGIMTCVGCTVPVLVPVLGILGGTGATLASTAYGWSYDVGTIVYVCVVYLLLRGQYR